MNKKLSALLTVVLSLCCLAIAHASDSDKYLNTVNLPVGNYKPHLSTILGSQPNEHACGQGQWDGFFVFKGDVDERNKMMNKVVLVQSWKQLEALRNNTLQSRLLENIEEEDFHKFDFAIVLVSFTGLRHLENERLYQQDGKVIFSFEVWERQAELVPACVWTKLHVLRLRKQS